MRLLVTGGGGFLGGAIARRLAAAGHRVRSFSRGDYPELQRLGIEVRRGDLGDARSVDDACREMDAVFHAGAKAGIWGPYEEFRRANVDGTRHVLDACRRHGIRRLVYTSSPSVVFSRAGLEGASESLPYPERFEAAYPETKAEAERLVLAAAGPALATVALRPHLIWGEGDNHLFPRILARARSGALRRISGPPKLVDTTYIDNAVDAHLLAFERLSPGCPISGKAYFIAQGEPLPLWEMIDRLLATAGVGPVTRSVPPGVAYAAGWVLEAAYRALRLPGEPKMTRFLAHQLSTPHWFDLTAAKRDLGYAPRVSLEEGLRRLAAARLAAAHPPPTRLVS
ncbi:MAG: NAD-dependent epimerase/dehydratase family protein [Elusimicrobia bacterium]|nr:NAD-dependent epimerase/dehydratase family protein [Elusimicrobiota bacterium]